MFNKGVDRMRRLVCEYYDGFSFGKFVKTYPHLKGTVTDLLIGDLFTDAWTRCGGRWSRSTRRTRSRFPTWTATAPAEVAGNKVNELYLPEGELR